MKVIIKIFYVAIFCMNVVGLEGNTSNLDLPDLSNLIDQVNEIKDALSGNLDMYDTWIQELQPLHNSVKERDLDRKNIMICIREKFEELNENLELCTQDCKQKEHEIADLQSRILALDEQYKQEEDRLNLDLAACREAYEALEKLTNDKASELLTNILSLKGYHSILTSKQDNFREEFNDIMGDIKIRVAREREDFQSLSVDICLDEEL